VDAAEPWAADIRALRHIGDFRCWQDHDVSVKAPEQLLRDLKPSDNAPRAEARAIGREME